LFTCCPPDPPLLEVLKATAFSISSLEGIMPEIRVN
jgi:hypothetical protein